MCLMGLKAQDPTGEKSGQILLFLVLSVPVGRHWTVPEVVLLPMELMNVWRIQCWGSGDAFVLCWALLRHPA